MKKKVVYFSICILMFSLGYFVGNCKLKAYKSYYNIVELVLDECQEAHNIMDTVGEGDTYSDYIEAKKALN